VEFYVDTYYLEKTLTVPPYSHTAYIGDVPNGTYVLTAKAYDPAGNIGISQPVSFHVNNDKTAPTVWITAPVSGASVRKTVSVNASASDNIGVNKVEFYIDGVLKYSDTVAPYSFRWNTSSYSVATHNLTAKAYDAAGNVGSSSVISVKVKK